MKKKGIAEVQIIAVLKETEVAETAREVCRRHNISERRACKVLHLHLHRSSKRRLRRQEAFA